MLRLLWSLVGLAWDWLRYRFWRWYFYIALTVALFFVVQLLALVLPLPEFLGVGVALASLLVALAALGIFLIIPSVVFPFLVPVWTVILFVQIGLSLAQLVRYQLDIPAIPVLTALLLVALSWLVGSGAYRPYEVRAIRRSLSSLAMWSAILLLLWQPVVVPAVGGVVSWLSESPVGMTYRIVQLRVERTFIGEEAKTSSLKELQGELHKVHKDRWDKGIKKIPELPLTPSEMKELGADP